MVLFKQFIFLLTLALISESIEAKVIHYGTETETITVLYGMPTILKFDSEVKTISEAQRFEIVPADEVEQDYSLLSLKPYFKRGTSHLHFILANGSVLNLKIIIVTERIKEKTDGLYDFRSKQSLYNLDNNLKIGVDITDLDLMKAMIRQDQIVGYKKQALNKKLKTGIWNVEARLLRVFTGPKFNGYVIKLRNRSKSKKYKIDLTKLGIGNPNLAVLGQIDQKNLSPRNSPGSETYLRVVAKPTSHHTRLLIPAALLADKKESGQ